MDERVAAPALLTDASSEMVSRNYFVENGAHTIAIDSALARSTAASAVADTARIFTAAAAGERLDAESALRTAKIIADAACRLPQALSSPSPCLTPETYTFKHSVDVAALSVIVGREMQMEADALNVLAIAGLLHDIGTMFVPADVIQKKGSLTAAEKETVRQHPVEGYKRLTHDGVNDRTAICALKHHEWMNGGGYPSKMTDSGIDTASRIIAICDVYSALITQSLYRPPFPPYKAVQIIVGESGSHFDAGIMKHFQRIVGIYPNGSVVRLSDGRIGRVIDQNAGTLLYPIIQVTRESTGNAVDDILIVDLARKKELYIKEVLHGALA